MSDLTGHTLGSYQILGEIGHGGMANVYRAIQPSIGREVAIKVLPAHFLQDRTFVERFTREVQIIARLQHPQILPVYDFGQHEGLPYIVMAYMPGGTLADRIRREGSLPLGEAVTLVEQIARGLDFAHRKGIVHRDFKPSNVLLDEEGNVHLSDFGIAKVTEETAHLTGSGIVGTPAYMAPEMARKGGVTPLVDVYALGATIFEMLTGQHPYQADTPMGVLMAHGSEPIPDVRDFRPDLPDAAQTVIEQAMAKDPRQRYQSAGVLAADLKATMSGASAKAQRIVPLPAEPLLPASSYAPTVDTVEPAVAAHMAPELPTVEQPHSIPVSPFTEKIEMGRLAAPEVRSAGGGRLQKVRLSSAAVPQQIMSLGVPLLVIIVGWALSWAAMDIGRQAVNRAAYQYLFLDGRITNFDLAVETADVIQWPGGTATSWILGALSIGLGMRLATPTVRWRHILILGAIWAVIGAAAGYEFRAVIIGDTVYDLPVASWTTVWAVAAFIGGLGIGIMLRRCTPGFSWRYVAGIAVAWMVGFAVGAAATALIDWAPGRAFGWAIAGAIGGAVTLWSLRRAR